MTQPKRPVDFTPTERDALKLSALAVGGLAVGGGLLGPVARNARAGQGCGRNACNYPENGWPTPQYTDLTGPDSLSPNTPLADDEMRITFLGSAFPPSRRAQQMMSSFVEVGP